MHWHQTNRGFETFGPGPMQGALGTGWPTGDRSRTADRARRETVRERRAFAEVRRAETTYSRQLRSVAQQISAIVRGLTPEGGIPDPDVVERAMRSYSQILRPWAKSVGARMLADVQRRDWAVWKSLAEGMSEAVKVELAAAPTGEALRRLLDEQVNLITSLPLDAAKRVHKLALEARVSGSRYDTIVKEIMRGGRVSKSRANLIARTEVARTASGLVQARATFAGSEGYIWRTVEDSAVRKSHKKMSGRFVRWDSPPTTDGLTGHAGQLPNCRCYPEPVLPDHIH